MDPATSTALLPNRGQKTAMVPHFRKHGALWAWTALLMVINLPLLWGEVRSGLLFLPEAVNSGQWWRVATYPLVHLSGYHLLLDAGGFLLLLSCLEERRSLANVFYIIGPSAGSLGLALAMDPLIHQRGLSGLSGIAHGLMAVTALEMLGHKNQRIWGVASLTAVVGKSAYELWSGQVLFEFMHMGLCGQPVAASHAGGVMGGLLAFCLFNAPGISRAKGTGRDARHTVEPALPPAAAQTLMGLMVQALTRLMYRVRYEGLKHIPANGPAVLVSNHVSYIDWLIIASASRRQVHFVMHASIYRIPVLHWIVRMAGVIPIDSGRRNPAVLHHAFKEMARVLRSGGLVCIFPEGRLTRTGRIDHFRPGVEKIIRQNPVPVIPLALRGLWGSFFSHKGGTAMGGWPQRKRSLVELAVGKRIPPDQVTAPRLRYTVQALYTGSA